MYQPYSPPLPQHTDHDGREPPSAPQLERFLTRLDGERRIYGAEAHNALRELLYIPSEIESRPRVEDTQQRILVLWRLVRIMTRICGITAEDETLDSTLGDITDPDPWRVGIQPTQSASTFGQQQVVRKPTANIILQAYLDAKEPDKPVTQIIPLLPNRETAVEWCRLVNKIVEGTGMEYPEQSAAGLHGLLDPATAHHHGVTPTQIFEVEELLIQEAQNLIIDQGERPAIRYFRDRHAFSANEASALIRLARAESMRSAGSNVDENRAIMIHQLKDFITRARAAMSLDIELRALKELAKVQGLYSAEPEDMMREFLHIVGRVSTKQDQLQQTNEEAITIDAEVLHTLGDGEDDDDATAMAAYDRENPRTAIAMLRKG